MKKKYENIVIGSFVGIGALGLYLLDSAGIEYFQSIKDLYNTTISQDLSSILKDNDRKISKGLTSIAFTIPIIAGASIQILNRNKTPLEGKL